VGAGKKGDSKEDPGLYIGSGWATGSKRRDTVKGTAKDTATLGELLSA
jgi:hypothetical protein